MKILIALSRFPHPMDKGDKLRAYYQIRDLSRNNAIYLVCLTEHTPPAESVAEMQKYCRELVIIPLGFFARLFHLFLGIFNTFPFQVNYFRSAAMKKEIRRIIRSEKIDVCYVQLIRLFLNIPFGEKTAYFLDYMDSFSFGMKKRFALSAWYEKPLIGQEARRLEKMEKEMAHHFQGLSVISAPDAKAIGAPQDKALHIVPNGVSESFFLTPQKTYRDKDIDLIFTGNMSYYPNVQACKVLVEKILPLLLQKGYPVKICLAGINPSSEVLSLKSMQVEVTGFVPDLRDYLSRARIFVAPLFTGSGLQNKILEAMAAGLPVITSPQANNALGAAAAEVVVCEDIQEFAQQIISLLENEQKARELGENGKNFIKNNYNWHKCNQELEVILNDCVKSQRKKEVNI